MRNVMSVMLTASMLVGCVSATMSTVYIIRHGEKTWALGCLNDVGKQRAAALPTLFNGKPSPSHNTFLTPQALFANQYDDPIDCERCKQTLEPISSYLGRSIDFNHGYPKKLGGNVGAAHAILNATASASVILIAWEHLNIQYLAADLGVPEAHIPAWPDSDYDTVYKLELHDSSLVNFTISKQNFHPSASASTAASVGTKPTVASAAPDPTAPVAALLERLLPDSSSHFQLRISGKPSCFSIDDVSDLPGHQIIVNGGDLATLAAGVGYYLRERANITIGWPRGGGSRVGVPAGGWPTMASSGGRLDVCRATEYSYFMNVCTHSYSLVWYGWDDWSRLIDWMALRGINVYLAMTGQEEVQHKVFTSLGVADADVRGWFNGPAFLTWSRGQNEYGSGIAGPLPRSFMKSQFALQKRILARSRSLGLIGQLPAFQGNVPVQLKALLHDTNMTAKGATAWMDALDPNFGKVADVWMKELLSSFGTDHWYQLDGWFNGGVPPWLAASAATAASAALVAPTGTGARRAPVAEDPLWRRRGAAAYRGLNATDPKAVWSYQGFAFEEWNSSDPKRVAALKGLVHAAPRGRMVLVDMDYAEGEWLRWGEPSAIGGEGSGYWGTPFIWTKLHEFGGTDGMRGNMTKAAELPARALDAGANVVGTGFTSEGIDQNPAYYDLILDSHFHAHAVRPAEYVVDRALRRYDLGDGTSSAASAAAHAWRLLSTSVYSQDLTTQDSTGVTHLPGRQDQMWAFERDRYTPTKKMCDLYSAWGLLIDVAAAQTADGRLLDEPLRYDLVDVGREVLAQIATPLSLNLSESMREWPHASPAAIEQNGSAYIALLTDLDVLLASDTAFTLGPWLAMARSVGDANASDCTGSSPTIPPEVVGCAHFYEWNARSQLTTWNPVPKGALKQPSGPIDYASKHWSGLLADYYVERARLLVASAAKHARDGQRFDNTVDEAVRAAHAYAFQVATKRYPTAPVGDALAVSRTMRTKHGARLSGCA